MHGDRSDRTLLVMLGGVAVCCGAAALLVGAGLLAAGDGLPGSSQMTVAAGEAALVTVWWLVLSVRRRRP